MSVSDWGVSENTTYTRFDAVWNVGLVFLLEEDIGEPGGGLWEMSPDVG